MMAPLPRVFISRPLPEQALACLQGRVSIAVGPAGGLSSPAVLQEGLHDSEAFVPMLSDRVDAALLRGATRLKIVANYAAGFNNVDVKVAEELGIYVTNTPDATTDATADMALGLMLACARRIPESEQCLRQGRFEGWLPMSFLGTLLSGSTLGIVGMGRIGRAVARRARGFDMKIVYASRRSCAEEDALGAAHVDLETLLRSSDFVSLHCPLTPETRHLIDASALAKMKRTAYLINTARGPVVDEEALARALREERLAGAALDVYEEEPRVHPRLLEAPRTVLVPHIGTSTLRTRLAMAEMALGDVLRVLEGQAPLHPVNAPSAPRSLSRRETAGA
jgi:glyoxylate reductase